MAELKVAVRLDAIPGEFQSRTRLQRGLAAVAQLGASSVELCARTILRPSELSDTGLRQLRKMLDDLNLRVASIRFQTRRGYDNPYELDRRVEATKEAMQLAYRLGAPVVVNQIGRIPNPARIEPVADKESQPFQSELPGPIETERASEQSRWNLLRSVMEDLGRYGMHVGSFLAAETGTEPGQWLAKLLDTGDQAFVAAALNPGQLIVNQHDVDEAVIALRDRIQLVSAVDGVLDLAAGRGLSVPLGQGIADFPQIIGRLEDVQYRGPFVVGRPTSAERRRAAGVTAEEAAFRELQQSVSYLTAI